MTSLSRSLCLALLVIVCASHDALADKTEAAIAKLHVREGQAAFDEGRYTDAAEEFEAAYVYKKLPAILFNAAQSRRLAKQTDKAIALYRDFMDLYPVDVRYEEAKVQLHALEHRPGAFSDLPVVEPPAKQVEAENEEPQVEEPPPPRAKKPPADRPATVPLYKKAWFWGAVGGGAVVLVTTITLAVVLTHSSPPWTNHPDIGPGSSAALSIRW